MATQSHVVLPGTERVPVPGARAVGAVDEHAWVEITVKLRRKAELPSPEAQPDMQLSRAQLAADYGASQEDIDTVTRVLSSYGLTIGATDAATRSVEVGGPASAMEKAFQVKLMCYAHEGGDYRGRVGHIRVPQELADIIVGVFGLDDRRVLKRRGGVGVLRWEAASFAAAVPSAQQRPWFFPAELAQIYDFPPGDGAGQTIALLEFGGGYFPQDLAAFCKIAGVAVPPVTTISVDHTPTNQHDGAEGEVMLDVEVVAGVCPKANIQVYFSSFDDRGWVDILDAVMKQETHPRVVSISWGNSEDNAQWTAQAIAQTNESLQAAALLGITVCVASGDDGSDDQVGDGHAHVDFPASSPYVLGVGGTTLRKHGAPAAGAAWQVQEVAWKDGDGLRNDGGGSTGGGVSVVFDRPKWQTVNIASVNPGAKSGRCVPDVAADASAHTGYFVVVNGKAGPSGGTSASAPLWAALIARINAVRGAAKAVGYLTPLLYSPAVATTGFRDIKQGNNTTATIGGYASGPGYDAVTGLGTPIGTKLLQALTASLTAAGAGG